MDGQTNYRYSGGDDSHQLASLEMLQPYSQAEEQPLLAALGEVIAASKKKNRRGSGKMTKRISSKFLGGLNKKAFVYIRKLLRHNVRPFKSWKGPEIPVCPRLSQELLDLSFWPKPALRDSRSADRLYKSYNLRCLRSLMQESS